MSSIVLFLHPGSMPPYNHVRCANHHPAISSEPPVTYASCNKHCLCSFRVYFSLGQHCVREGVCFSLSSRVHAQGLKRQESVANFAPSGSVSKSFLSYLN